MIEYREDNDDDGETAAGGRVAHLLQILVCTYSKNCSCIEGSL